MKHLLFIFLLIAIPFQTSWGAASNYCQHENGKAAQHFGHHEHLHHPSSDQKSSKSKVSAIDADCGFCHHHSFTNLVSAEKSVPVLSKASTPVEFRLLAYHSHIPDSPSKPNWQRII